MADKKNKTRSVDCGDKIVLPPIYKQCGYHPDDIITKWAVDNRTYPSK